MSSSTLNATPPAMNMGNVDNPSPRRHKNTRYIENNDDASVSPESPLSQKTTTVLLPSSGMSSTATTDSEIDPLSDDIINLFDSLSGVGDEFERDIIIARVEAAENKITKYYGRSTRNFSLGKASYVGQMEGGKKHGFGTYTYTSGSNYVGQYKRGYQHGFGIMTEADGTIYYSGEWENNNPKNILMKEEEKKTKKKKK